MKTEKDTGSERDSYTMNVNAMREDNGASAKKSDDEDEMEGDIGRQKKVQRQKVKEKREQRRE